MRSKSVRSTHRPMRSRWGLAIVLALFCAACGEVEVYGDLSQADANEMVVLLAQSGLAAQLTKITKQNETKYGVQVPKAEIDRARAILQQNNLPKQKKPGLAEIYKSSGPIPSAQEQRARYILALKGEIVNALEQKIPDVIEADVLLNIPTEEPLSIDAVPQKPSASVVLKVRPTEQALATLTEEKIQRFVANAVSKLDPRDVSVIVTYVGSPPGAILPGQGVILPQASNTPTKPNAAMVNARGAEEETVSIAGIQVNAESAGRLKLYLGLFLGLLAALSLGLIVMVIQSSRLRDQSAGNPELLPPMAPPPQLGVGHLEEAEL